MNKKRNNNQIFCFICYYLQSTYVGPFQSAHLHTCMNSCNSVEHRKPATVAAHYIHVPLQHTIYVNWRKWYDCGVFRLASTQKPFHTRCSRMKCMSTIRRYRYERKNDVQSAHLGKKQKTNINKKRNEINKYLLNINWKVFVNVSIRCFMRIVSIKKSKLHILL